MQIIKAVPTNIITGSLGAGKTTFVKRLLENKPAHERWAVLVNEFGEIGIDGALLAGQRSSANKDSSQGDTQNVFVREVPGGCMCCASGLPMQIALNQLLAIATPDRLLIEPTGLGHPKELLQILTSAHYRDVIQLQASVCLVDARKTSQQKWREHQTFIDQLQIADMIIATKSDLYANDDMPRLIDHLRKTLLLDTPVDIAIKGSMEIEVLSLLNKIAKNEASVSKPLLGVNESRQKQNYQDQSVDSLPNTPTTASNSGEGFHSHGWTWPSSVWLDYQKIIKTFEHLKVERIKGLLITTEGIFGFNGQGSELEINEYDEANESRLEIITDSESDLFDAVQIIHSAFPSS